MGPPGSHFDLANYHLTLPTDTAVPGTPDSVSGAQLQAGYTSAYFYSGSDGGMTFWSPVDGAHTPGSTYPRCELREEMTPGSVTANWRVSSFSTSALHATVTVLQTPPNRGDLGIGQIHEYQGSDKPLVLLHYTNGLVHAKVLLVEGGSSYTDLVFDTVPLGTPITYELAVSRQGVLTVTVDGASQSLTLDPSWMGVDLYFKAGVYCLENGTSSTEGCRASFSQLTRVHTP